MNSHKVAGAILILFSFLLLAGENGFAQDRRDYIVTHQPSVNVRPCPRFTEECAPLYQLAAGTILPNAVVVRGASYDTSNFWIAFERNLDTVFIHRSLVDYAPPEPTATRTAVPGRSNVEASFMWLSFSNRNIDGVDTAIIKFILPARDSSGHIAVRAFGYGCITSFPQTERFEHECTYDNVVWDLDSARSLDISLVYDEQIGDRSREVNVDCNTHTTTTESTLVFACDGGRTLVPTATSTASLTPSPTASLTPSPTTTASAYIDRLANAEFANAWLYLTNHGDEGTVRASATFQANATMILRDIRVQAGGRECTGPDKLTETWEYIPLECSNPGERWDLENIHQVDVHASVELPAVWNLRCVKHISSDDQEAVFACSGGNVVPTTTPSPTTTASLTPSPTASLTPSPTATVMIDLSNVETADAWVSFFNVVHEGTPLQGVVFLEVYSSYEAGVIQVDVDGMASFTNGLSLTAGEARSIHLSGPWDLGGLSNVTVTLPSEGVLICGKHNSSTGTLIEFACVKGESP